MKIQISLSVGTPVSVLELIAGTIKSPNPGFNTPDTYGSAKSCYGRVAYALRENKKWNPRWEIMLFGTKGVVVHAMLYDAQNDKPIVDSFSVVNKGHVVNDKNRGTYYRVPTRDEDIPLMKRITLSEFKRFYL